MTKSGTRKRAPDLRLTPLQRNILKVFSESYLHCFYLRTTLTVFLLPSAKVRVFRTKPFVPAATWRP